MGMLDQINRLRSSTLIREKNFGEISSFNFTKKAFFESKWNELTTKARGLFINTRTGEIVARGYDKFFNLDENESNRRTTLRKKLAFPVCAYRKENGFLGLISLDAYSQIRFATKSSLEGTYVDILKNAFVETVVHPEEVVRTLRQTKTTMLVEVIDPVNDPHIIEYENRHIVMLDLVANEWNTKCVSYHDLVKYSKEMGIPCKQLSETYETWVDLEHAIDNWLREDYREDGEPIEGYVVVDRNGLMFKVKTGYYTKWKKRRYQVNKIMAGKDPEYSDRFLTWVCTNKKMGHINETDSLIDLRNKYEAEIEKEEESDV